MAPPRGKKTYQKILVTKAANAAAAARAERARLECSFEEARRILQRKGYSVFAEHVLGGEYRMSKLYRVGRRQLTRDEVLDFAAKLIGEKP